MLNIARRDGTNYVFLLDDDRYEDVLAAGPWHVVVPSPKWPHYYAAHTNRGRKQYMHRFLLGEEALYVDHRNGNTLDNRLANLRVCTASENASNIRLDARVPLFVSPSGEAAW